MKNITAVINQFPWNKFGTVYETNAKGVKEILLKIIEGNATEKEYIWLIHRLEHQDWLYKISPWGLKFYFALLKEENTDKTLILNHIGIIFRAANWGVQVDKQRGFQPTKKDMEKYQWLKEKLLDENFSGELDEEFLKNLKRTKRNFWNISVLDYIENQLHIIKHLTNSSDENIRKEATTLLQSIETPQQYEFQ